MKNKRNFLIYPLLLMGVLIVFASSCKKDDDDDNESSSAGSFTDYRDSNVYQTVTIGSQVWMAENLRYLPSVAGTNIVSPTKPYYYVYGYNGIALVLPRPPIITKLTVYYITGRLQKMLALPGGICLVMLNGHN